MTKQAAVVVKNISKHFILPHQKANSIKSFFISPFNRFDHEKQRAFENISFEVKKGEFLGIVGRNGSGKSTLLKCIAGVYTTDTGKVTVNGKLVPFIELGVGFNPELSGRDNIFLNGALLGFSRKEINAMYEEIVEFSELERFMDQKLKNYSSGMQVRLAFSIAIRAKGDILLLDEVLAVGDSAFQRKCFDYFAELKRSNKTVVLVTHDMSAVQRFCDRAILIDDGNVVIDGETDLVTKKYSDLNFQKAVKDAQKPTKKKHQKKNEGIEIDTKVIGSASGDNAIQSDIDKNISIEFSITAKSDIGPAKFGTIVNNSSNNPIFATNTLVNNIDMTIKKGKTVLIIKIDNIFSNGEYFASAGLTSLDGSEIYYTEDKSGRFIVGGRQHEYALTSPGYNIHLRPQK